MSSSLTTALTQSNAPEIIGYLKASAKPLTDRKIFEFLKVPRKKVNKILESLKEVKVVSSQMNEREQKVWVLNSDFSQMLNEWPQVAEKFQAEEKEQSLKVGMGSGI